MKESRVLLSLASSGLDAHLLSRGTTNSVAFSQSHDLSEPRPASGRTGLTPQLFKQPSRVTCEQAMTAAKGTRYH